MDEKSRKRTQLKVQKDPTGYGVATSSTRLFLVNIHAFS